MSEARRQTRIVYDAFMEIVTNGKSTVRQADVIETLRTRNQPLGIWKVTGEFSTLAQLNLIQLDPETGLWFAIEGRSFDEAVEEYNGNWETLPTGR